MSHKQQLMAWIGGGLLLLTAIVTGILMLFQREPDAGLPSETTALTTIFTTTAETTTDTTTESTTSASTALTEMTTSTATSTETTTSAAETSTTTASTTTSAASTAMKTTTTESTVFTTIQTTASIIQTETAVQTTAAGASADDPPVTEPPATEPPATEPPATEPPATDPPATEPPAAGPTYIDGVLIVNKSYPLPKDYNPGLDPTCKAQFDLLAKAAADEGLNIWLASGFRSYERQKTIYNNYVNWYGQAKTDTLSARPGHSEHQTGLAIDVNSVTDSFGSTPEAAWLAEHAHEFGFIIRYPKGKEHITGYKYEPWHIRYLGVDMATTIYNSGLTLEEYFGITSCYAE